MSDPLRDNAAGIDVSHWQGIVPPLGGLDFLIARASIGAQTDSSYDMHITAARKAGLLTGAYHFGMKQVDAATQAKTFLLKAGDVDFYVFDHEGANAMTDAEAQRFIDIVKKDRGHCGLYASLSGFPSFGQSFNWIALWASTPPANRPWAFWQFGGVNAIDHDVFNGSPAQLRAFAQSLKGEPMGLDIIIGDKVGTLAVPVGTPAIAVSTHADYKTTLTTNRRAVTAQIAPAGSAGYVVNLNGNIAHFIRASSLAADAFKVDAPAADTTTPFSQADLDKAAADAVATLKTRIRAIL